jgi:WD40 repeat protein
MDWSPFHRNLFITGGADGMVKLFHILEQTPIMKWEPCAANPQGKRWRIVFFVFLLIFSLLDMGSFISVTAVAFSPHRPMVFACSTNDGFIYIYDLMENKKLPVVVLEANEKLVASLSAEQLSSTSASANDNSSVNQSNNPRGKKAGGLTDFGGDNNKNSIIQIAFNHKQRDLIAACDYFGQVFLWKLSWKLSNRNMNEITVWNSLADIFSTTANNGENRKTGSG